MQFLMDNVKFIQSRLPLADGLNAGSTAVLDMREYDKVCFQISIGAVASGADVTFTVEACNDDTPDSTAASYFWYTVDTDLGNSPAAKTRANTYNWTAADGAADTLILIETTAADLKTAAGSTFDLGGCRLTIVENANKTCAASITAILHPARHSGAVESMPAGLYA